MDYGLSEFWACHVLPPQVFSEVSLKKPVCLRTVQTWVGDLKRSYHSGAMSVVHGGFLAQLFLHLQVSPLRADRQGRALAYQLSVLNLCFQNWPRVSEVLDIYHLLNVPVHLVW